ncbi:MAG: DUF2141 domain-containing protein [Sphingomonadaceae bacterium]|nr:DUF2141 domain-containing protein [Sphingomonadaceae bacterium]
MGKLRIGARWAALAGTGGALIAFAASPLAADPLGPYAAACAAGSDRPAVLVRVIGFKAREGRVRVQAYGGDPAHYFDKGSYLKRIELPVPAQGPVEICVPLPKPGIYAVTVRHDADGTGKTSMADGGGMSGNPSMSLWEVMLHRKPAPEKVEVRVGDGVVTVPVVLNYVQGGSFRPVSVAAR